MKALFVTGTDTGVGKTIVCGLLGRFLSNNGYRAIIQKWIQAGSNNFPKNVNVCYTFKYPASPHLAAGLEKRRINAGKIKKSFKFLKKGFDFVIVEGIGGALVPFNEKRLVIDIAKELYLPVLIVVANKLGAINHSLLTIEAVKRRNMKIMGVIFNNRYKSADKIILEDNAKIVKALSGEKILGILPYCKDRNKLHKAFLPIGGKILRQNE